MSSTLWKDNDRMPTLDEAGSARLKRLLDQPHAPKFHNQSGNHLQKDELIALDAYAAQESKQTPTSNISDNPWLEGFISKSRNNVPFYRHYTSVNQFHDYPTIRRADLSKDITQFVPDDLPLDRVIAYDTSGTTGHALSVPSHPTVAARYSAFHKKALLLNGVDTKAFKSDLAVMLAGYQEKCFTYASISPYLNNKGLAKLNFHPNDWHNPNDREKYIDENQPDLISGDPISLAEVSKLPFTHSPKAVLSTSMTLLKELKAQFETRFSCPVINLYSLNEVGPIGCSIPDKDGFLLLQSKLFIEILDKNGKPTNLGERGEITVTGGFNDYLPLIRYRTGDFGRLNEENGQWFIQELEGRPPVRFKTSNNTWLNNVDITHLMQQFPLSQFSLHQCTDGQLKVTLPNTPISANIQQTLEATFGYPVSIQHFKQVSSDAKVIQYTSDLIHTTNS